MNGSEAGREFRGGILRRWRLIALLVALLVVLISSVLIGLVGRLLLAL